MRTGIDIIEIDRIARVYQRRPRQFLNRVFTRQEQQLLIGRKYVEKHLAARFAAKEAVLKLLGLGIGPLSWKEVEILALPSGEPLVKLHKRAAAQAKVLALTSIALSLSHSRNYAVAQAVALSITKE
ncbi:MAG: holo-ACP synthase [Firmicutes bacterium]|nr:holo-ACP synthase [Bacillota bacterium]